MQKLKDCSHKVIEFTSVPSRQARRDHLLYNTTYKIFFKVNLNSIKPGNKQSDADYLQKLHVPSPELKTQTAFLEKQGVVSANVCDAIDPYASRESTLLPRG